MTHIPAAVPGKARVHNYPKEEQDGALGPNHPARSSYNQLRDAKISD